MGAFELVGLVIDTLAQVLVGHVAQQEFGAHRPLQLALGQIHGKEKVVASGTAGVQPRKLLAGAAQAVSGQAFRRASAGPVKR